MLAPQLEFWVQATQTLFVQIGLFVTEEQSVFVLNWKNLPMLSLLHT
jgi:hypothetical protein